MAIVIFELCKSLVGTEISGKNSNNSDNKRLTNLSISLHQSVFSKTTSKL